MTSMTTDRLTCLRNYLAQKLEEIDGDDAFIEDGPNRIMWISSDEGIEVVVITLEPGRIEVEQ